jgi:signal transduction histidine kinase
MRIYFFWISLLLGCTSSIAQDVCHIDKLNEDGITLNKCWKFQQGDSVQWASTNFDDSKWQPIDPVKDIHALPELKPGVIGWFRLSFTLDKLEERQLGMIMQSSGASEFYLDGKLINRFGEISINPAKIKAYDPLLKPVSLFVSDQPKHVLAVRYVLKPNVIYSTMYETKNPAILVRLVTLKNAIDIYGFFTSSIVGMHLCIIGTCLLLAILHLAFYIFYPAQKANRSFAIYALGFIVFNVIQNYFLLHGNEVSSKFFLANLSMDIRIANNLFLLTALYNLLEHRKDKVYWTLIALAVISVFLNIWPYDIGWRIGGASFELLIGAGVTRIAYMANRKGKRGAWIILGGAISYFVFFSVFFSYIFIPNQSFLLNLSIPRIVFYILSFLSIPLATSIFLGLDFAFTNRSLSEKLKEIEDLSEKSIRQEKEKQEILEAQNETLEMQVQERTDTLRHSIDELKSTQNQLIQKEKMASLGELTSGIAHEIQNPLNFVNNFSDVNTELIDDLKSELEANNKEEALAIANDIKENEQKINHHGKRADAIVKGMLQHSRASTGKKELTDINALADEYLRLAYHGLRAKDKDFNANFKTDFDESIGKIEVVQQDIGRVLLNLYNNAFYAVNEKKKQLSGTFEPIVEVSTKSLGNKVEISVRDNGNGIPQKVLDKIFQPFFTTKPTGQGTGLGLSLSYDIIKAHGGEIKVETNEGEGTEFKILLPGATV